MVKTNRSGDCRTVRGATRFCAVPRGARFTEELANRTPRFHRVVTCLPPCANHGGVLAHLVRTPGELRCEHRHLRLVHPGHHLLLRSTGQQCVPVLLMCRAPETATLFGLANWAHVSPVPHWICEPGGGPLPRESGLSSHDHCSSPCDDVKGARPGEAGAAESVGGYGWSSVDASRASALESYLTWQTGSAEQDAREYPRG